MTKQSISPNSSFTDTFKEGDFEINLPGIDVVDKFMASFYRKPKNTIERILVGLVEVIRTKAAHIERNGYGMFELHAPADEDPYIKLGPLRIKANSLDIEVLIPSKVRFETILPIGEHEAIINMGDAANTAQYLTFFLRHNDLNSI